MKVQPLKAVQPNNTAFKANWGKIATGTLIETSTAATAILCAQAKNLSVPETLGYIGLLKGFKDVVSVMLTTFFTGKTKDKELNRAISRVDPANVFVKIISNHFKR